MVNATKHRELLNDTPTRVNKRINKIFCLSNNAKKKDLKEDEFIMANIGKAGVTEIIRTNDKRKKAKRSVLYGLN